MHDIRDQFIIDHSFALLILFCNATNQFNVNFWLVLFSYLKCAMKGQVALRPFSCPKNISVFRIKIKSTETPDTIRKVYFGISLNRFFDPHLYTPTGVLKIHFEHPCGVVQGGYVCTSSKVILPKCRSPNFCNLHFDELSFRRCNFWRSIISKMSLSTILLSWILVFDDLHLNNRSY